jgi:hypothetical protein
MWNFNRDKTQNISNLFGAASLARLHPELPDQQRPEQTTGAQNLFEPQTRSVRYSNSARGDPTGLSDQQITRQPGADTNQPQNSTTYSEYEIRPDAPYQFTGANAE